MAKKADKKVEAKANTKPKATAVEQGIKKRLAPQKEVPTYAPDSTDRVVRTYVKRRISEMQDWRRSLGIENRWREADEEYIPHELDFGTTRKRFETDQDTGLRSRMVPVGDITQQWRQASSAPTLLAKIQTAVSMIIDQQPEADLVALVKKYAATTELAYSLWKRNWQITDAKEKLKLVVFDLIRYGWAAQRTFPRTITYDKRILVSKDTENPENDTYEDKQITWFSDIDRQPLNVFRTWIDELASPYDQYSVNEGYYEMDFSYDQAKTEFGKYPNFDFVKMDSAFLRQEENRKGNRVQANQEKMTRKDIVTIGFFQSRLKDLFVIYVPADDIVLYKSPLPNDDGYIDITQTLWILRKSNLPYGVSLWEVIRQNKTLYDKMKNMTMDQLVLSIMKFGFFSGTNTALGDGKIEIVPGQARQLTSSTGKPEINWMEIPGPGEESWKGIEAVQAMMDDESGISPTMEGEITGKTLGEIMQAKEAALKRLKVPVENIAWLIEQDAYLTLSWMGQVYSTPQVVEFSDATELAAFNQENAVNHTNLFGTPGNDSSGAPSDSPSAVGAPYQAHYYPELALHLENREGQLVKSKDSNFLQVGKDIKVDQLKWKGIFKIIPASLFNTDETIERAAKMEMSNMLVPLLTQPMELMAKPAQQICEVNEEDPKDWLPPSWIQYLETGQLPPPPPGMGPDGKPLPPAPPPQNGPMAGGPAQSMQGGTGAPAAPAATPAQTIVPKAQVSAPATSTPGGLFKRRI